MKFLNSNIAKLAKHKKPNLVRKPISCGIFQELEEKGNTYAPTREQAKR